MKKIVDAFKWVFRVLGYAGYRFYWDDCFSRASALAYATLFSLVPMAALGFSMFSVFGVEESQLSQTLQSVILQVLPPIENAQIKELKDQLFQYLNLFAQNVRALNTLSIAVLFFTAVALLNTIESALNVIWRVSSSLSLFSKLISFWAVITIGPLLIALSIYWYAKVNAFTESDPLLHSWFFTFTDFFVPLAATWIATTLLYYKLPAANVRLKDALFGAFFAALVFEFVKRAFAYYVGLSTTYSTIYGVLATIPLFLFWLYVTWCVVLFGAEISYQAGSIKILHGLRKYASDLGEVGAILGLRILVSIGKNFIDGKKPPSEGEIALETGSDPVRVRTCLDILTKSGLISVSDPDEHTRALTVAPERLTIGKVMETFRSKAYRLEIDTSSGENGSNGSGQSNDDNFLEWLRKAALRIDSKKSVETWTLSELLP